MLLTIIASAVLGAVAKAVRSVLIGCIVIGMATTAIGFMGLSSRNRFIRELGGTTIDPSVQMVLFNFAAKFVISLCIAFAVFGISKWMRNRQAGNK